MARILIVDDQKSVLITLEALLRSEDHQVTACLNAIDAINHLTNEHYDLVITDAIMPVGGTGYALIRTIRNHPQLLHMPVILLTGKREKADVEKGIEAGADDYVVKPIDPPLLLAKIKNILTQAAAQSPNFVEAPVQVRAEWESKTDIVSVSELGLTLHTNMPVPVGSLMRLTSPLFDEIQISKPSLRIASREELKTPEGHFKVTAHFVGLSEKELTPLRLWIRNKKSF